MARVFDPVERRVRQPAEVSPSRAPSRCCCTAGTTSRPTRSASIIDRTLAGHGAGRRCTTSSAAASTATAWTPSGSSRTSRRCRTTTRSCCGLPRRLRAVRHRGVCRGRAGDRALGARGGVGSRGGYAASQDADVGLEDDGDYFTWTRDEAAAVLGPGRARSRRRVLRHRHRGRDAPQSRRRTCSSSPRPSPSWLTRTGRARGGRRALLLASAPQEARAARDQRTAPFVDRTRYTELERDDGLGACCARARCWTTTGRGATPSLTLELLRRESTRPTPWPTRRVASAGCWTTRCRPPPRRSMPTRPPATPPGSAGPSAIMDRVWRDYWDDERGRPLRYRHGAGGRGPAAADAGQAGPGHADPVAQRRRRDRRGAAARAHRRARGGSERRSGIGGGLRGAAPRSSGSTAPPICWRWTGTLNPGHPPRRDRRPGRIETRRRCTGMRWRRFVPRRVVQRLSRRRPARRLCRRRCRHARRRERPAGLCLHRATSLPSPRRVETLRRPWRERASLCSARVFRIRPVLP